MKKDSGLRIRVERELREKFLKLCQQQDRPAAQVLREFMRDYLAKYENTNSNASQNLNVEKHKLIRGGK
ncbi:hypothetical protein [Hyphococcus sp.]|uniref:hypothetical protein n=1 Tax=Hyphococcus sp. TaxID=2038636 RepID=UPI003D0D2006